MLAPYAGSSPVVGSSYEFDGLVIVRNRYAARSVNKCAALFVTSGVSCCSGPMSSRMKKPRPYVLITRSLKCSCTTIPDTGACGRSACNGCHCSPASNET